MGSGGFVFALLAFLFALSAQAKVRKLEERLRNAGLLEDDQDGLA